MSEPKTDAGKKLRGLAEKWRSARERQRGYGFGSEFANNVRRECASQLEACIAELEEIK